LGTAGIVAALISLAPRARPHGNASIIIPAPNNIGIKYRITNHLKQEPLIIATPPICSFFIAHLRRIKIHSALAGQIGEEEDLMDTRRLSNIPAIAAIAAAGWSMLGVAPAPRPAHPPEAAVEVLSVGVTRPLEYADRQRLSNFRGHEVRLGTFLIFQAACPEGDILTVTDFTLLRLVDDKGTDLTVTPARDSRAPFDKPFSISPDSSSVIGYVASGASPAPDATALVVTASITARIGVGRSSGASALITIEPGQILAVPGGTLTLGVDQRRSLIEFTASPDAAPVQTILFAREDGVTVPAEVTHDHNADRDALIVRLPPGVTRVRATPILYSQIKTVHVPVQQTFTVGSASTVARERSPS
jgi:hypothetical protein